MSSLDYLAAMIVAAEPLRPRSPDFIHRVHRVYRHRHGVGAIARTIIFLVALLVAGHAADLAPADVAPLAEMLRVIAAT
jgi:hypothetical protein